MECLVCGRDLQVKATGRPRKTCSTRCRVALSRRRKTQPLGMFHEQRRWVRADGKRPITVDGRSASSTDPATWVHFCEVTAGPGDGLGVMLGGGLGCYDLDGAVHNGVIKPWARSFIDSIPEPIIHTEKSMSGRGVHVFVQADEGRGSRRAVGDGHVERYTRARFIRMGTPMKL